MGSHSKPFTDKAGGAIDRKRERERRMMLQTLYKNAPDLSVRLVQRLLDKHILETTSNEAISKIFAELFEKMAEMEEFEMQYKIAPIRQLVIDPNFLSLYVTQFIIEDLVEHEKVQDIFGDDLEIYRVVDSVLGAIRPPE